MGKELRIMLVDDDEMFVESLSDILSEEGYHVEKAFSPQLNLAEMILCRSGMRI